MKIEHTDIYDIILIKPKIFQDNRGYFFESFHKEILAQAGIHEEFVQDNQSLSARGIIRGMHFQVPPFAQGKLVRVIKGAVIDVAVDLRKSSPTYGKHIKQELNEENKMMMWIPAGFAHGFLSLEDNTIFHYKCTQYYNKQSEICLRWDDPDLNIQWGDLKPFLSEKDQSGDIFRNFLSPF
ncbi:MAG: dTDP-4-dehydrorhamnose 3,5-epimerase [Bacteroidales bacterium]